MPILALDQFGQIYETSPDREDGQGIKDYPEDVYQQDCTMGNAYLKSQAQQRDFVLRERQSRKLEDAHDAAHRAEMMRRHKAKMTHEARMGELMNQQDIVQSHYRKAIQMGCPCDYKQPLAGNVMSANGMSGYHGMTRDQQAIHHALNPHKYGKNPAFGVDASEQKQHEMRQQAYRLLYNRSRGPVR